MRQKKKLRQLNKILAQVRSYQGLMKALSDEALRHLTIDFRERLAKGESLDAILPEAYAAICEADARVLGKFPYDVQVLGAIAIHQGNLIEMNTGEGKTLMATMPLYLNALTGKSTILVTTNEYLALRDAQEMGQVYRFMGLTIAAGVQEKTEERFSNEEKQKIYAADIVYTTHSTFGFDYLLNNLVTSASERFLRDLYFVMIDEADSVLLDSAQTPLVISGAPRVQSNLYELADFFVTTLEEGRDYEQEDKKVWLTAEGIRYTEQFFKIDNFYDSRYFEINRHVTLALRAHVLFEREKEYMISKDGELQLLDSGSGRMMPGVKLRGGQHQALEMKEKLKITRENRSIASITYQNLFLNFEKMSGMSGTISDAREEIKNVYGLDVVVIPTNCPLQRKDLKDLYFRDKDTQFQRAIQSALDAHAKGQPVLIVVSTIRESEQVSRLLMNEKIPHNVLNANNAFWEAQIIREAGQKDAVTVATAMAGRGTDIQLGDGVKELGGLAVIGIGRMANIRQERQARGRAGRQGDPGSSRFFVCLEDEIVQRSGPVDSRKYVDDRIFLTKKKLKRMIDSAQRVSEEFAVLSRKQALDYDLVLQKQRELIYSVRNHLLDGEEMQREKVLNIAEKRIALFLSSSPRIERADVDRYILDNISYELDGEIDSSCLKDKKKLKNRLMRKVEKALKQQEYKLGDRALMEEFMRLSMLRAIDDAWVEQVDYLQQLQSAVSGRASAQRNLLFEYQQDALESFRKMEADIQRNMIRNILLCDVYIDADEKLCMILP